jgi:hypothetical protein
MTFSNIPQLTCVSSRPSEEHIESSPEENEGVLPLASHKSPNMNKFTIATSMIIQNLELSTAKGESRVEARESDRRANSDGRGRPPSGNANSYSMAADAPPVRLTTHSGPKRRVTFNEDVEVLRMLASITTPMPDSSSSDTEDSNDDMAEDSEEQELDDSEDDAVVNGDADNESSNSTPSDNASSQDSEADESDETGSKDSEQDEVIDDDHEEVVPLPESTMSDGPQSSHYWDQFSDHNSQVTIRSLQRLANPDELTSSHEGVASGSGRQTNWSAADQIDAEMAMDEGELYERRTTARDAAWKPKRPVSSHRFLEVDDEIDDTSSPMRDEDDMLLNDYDTRHRFQNMSGRGRRVLQASVELGDPRWTPHNGHSPEIPETQPPNRGIGFEEQSYFAMATEAMSKQFPTLRRTKSMPTTSQSWQTTEENQEHCLSDEAVPSPYFRPALSQLQRSQTNEFTSQDVSLRALTRKMSIEAGTCVARGRLQTLPFKPPFLTG